MPFDGVAAPFGYLAKFDRVIDLIEAPNQWIKNSYSTPWGGYCLKEALNAVGVADIFEPMILKVAEEVMETDFCCVESFNDYPQTAHADVVTVLKRVRTNVASGRFKLPASPGPRPAFVAGGRRDGRLAGFWRKIFGRTAVSAGMLAPQFAARDAGAFGERGELDPDDARVDLAGRREACEPAIGAGDDVFAADHLGKAANPLGDKLLVLDDVG